MTKSLAKRNADRWNRLGAWLMILIGIFLIYDYWSLRRQVQELQQRPTTVRCGHQYPDSSSESLRKEIRELRGWVAQVMVQPVHRHSRTGCSVSIYAMDYCHIHGHCCVPPL